MKTGNGKLSSKGKVGVETAVVGREEDLGSDGNELGIGGSELLLVVGSSVENEEGLINLHPVGARSLEVTKELLVQRKQLGKEGDGLEASLGLLCGLAEDEERDGAEDDGTGGDTNSLGFLELLNCLVEEQLEVGVLGELGDDEVVVRVEPSNTVRENQIFSKRICNVPLLHLGGGDIDAVSLTTTAHCEIKVQRRKVLADVTLGDDVERCGVIEYMVIEREVAAVSKIPGQSDVSSGIPIGQPSKHTWG